MTNRIRANMIAPEDGVAVPVLSGRGIRCRTMADEVLTELESIGTGWNEDDIERIQSSLLPRIYDLLNLLAATVAKGADLTAAEARQLVVEYGRLCSDTRPGSWADRAINLLRRIGEG